MEDRQIMIEILAQRYRCELADLQLSRGHYDYALKEFFQCEKNTLQILQKSPNHPEAIYFLKFLYDLIIECCQAQGDQETEKLYTQKLQYLKNINK